eukprot:TRINITY_DN7472_c0_g1_i4.p1 TRINITY_DN7472_c0_g1~~TRINITY_DN7472_c0_g1_i4.p1  ORF type:complete len:227 (+),score=83.30 TRINITY_DN7472_c0_g1_i4:37-681(+)
MYKVAVVSIFLLGTSFGSPVPQVEDKEESGSKAIFSLFSQLASVVQKTGDVISQLSKNYTDMPELTQAGERISEAGEDLPGDFNDIVQDNFKMLLQILPGIKHNITEAMNQLPGIREQISENIDMLPTKDDIKDNVEPLLEALGVFAEDDVVDDIRSQIEDHVDSLPSKDYIDENIQMALDNIPSADYVNSRVDDFLDQVSPIVEELNETGGRK